MFDAVLQDWPDFGYADDVRPALAANRQAGAACVLATLAELDGSGPRPVGSQMVFGEAAVAGFLSGGCVEAALATEAEGVLHTGEPAFIRYGRGSPFPDIQLVCGSGIGVLLERIAPDDGATGELLAASAARRPVIWLTDGRRRACLSGEAPPPALNAAAAAARAERSSPAGLTDGQAWKRFDPPWRLLVVGSDPTAMATAELAARSGFQTTLYRPKGPEAPPPISGVRYLRGGDVETTVTGEALDRWTAVAIATHDAELDAAVTAAVLRTPAPYVGALGARRRLPERLARLRDQGFGEAELQRLQAPIGLPLGGKSPWEIAVSIVGEVVRFRHAAGGAG